MYITHENAIKVVIEFNKQGKLSQKKQQKLNIKTKELAIDPPNTKRQKKLRRYKKCENTRKQFRIFSINQKRFYQSVLKNTDESINNPSNIEDIETSGANPTEHNRRHDG